ADLLTKFGVKVWFAPAILKIGDSLSRSIDKGLANAKFGVVVLSKAYIAICDLATYLGSPTVLCKEQAPRVALSRESQARGRGSPRGPWATSTAYTRSESGCPITAQGSGYWDL